MNPLKASHHLFHCSWLKTSCGFFMQHILHNSNLPYLNRVLELKIQVSLALRLVSIFHCLALLVVSASVFSAARQMHYWQSFLPLFAYSRSTRIFPLRYFVLICRFCQLNPCKSFSSGVVSQRIGRLFLFLIHGFIPSISLKQNTIRKKVCHETTKMNEKLHGMPLECENPLTKTPRCEKRANIDQF